jgi:hypothetical protein
LTFSGSTTFGSPNMDIVSGIFYRQKQNKKPL